MQAGAPNVEFEVKANCFCLWVAPNYASTGLSCAPLHFLGFLRVNGEGKGWGEGESGKEWGAEGAPLRGGAVEEKT